MSGPILAVGAAGKFAGYIVPALVARGATVRGLVHEAKALASIRDEGAADVVVGDLRDRRSIAAALKGVESVFYVAPAFLTDEAQVGVDFVAAAVKAGVRRFVFSSVIHPVLSALSNHAAKAPVEEAILDSGLEYTLLHPALFFQNYARAWPGIVRTRVLAEPWSSDTRFSRVDYRDVAEVAALALTEDRLLYGTFELCAEGWLNRHDVAALAGAVLGRTVRAERIDPDTLGDQAGPMRPMFEHYDHTGLRGNALILRAILGREPRTLRAFFEEMNGPPRAAILGEQG
ncbi:MAG: NmrA family NAD(P)-binding protein [Acetobacteraceae bacterium]|nr:NmrA family NAD(P)-binding protein [Acetobacteraceae bacterium]